MIDITLQVVPKPVDGTASVVVIQTMEPTFKGEGQVNFNCGECGFRVAESLENAAQISNVVIACPSCKSYNVTRL